MSERYVIKKSSNGQWYFQLKAANSETILVSETYTAKQNAFNGITSCRNNCSLDKNYGRLRAKNDQYYFVLKAGNGEIVGVSEMYVTKAGMETGISSVKANGPTSNITDDS